MIDSVMSYCVGMDVDKNTFKACMVARLTSGQTLVKASKTFPNKEIGFKELLRWKEKYYKHQVACSFLMEATGVYHEHLAYFLYQKDQCVHIVLANKAKRYIQSLGIRSKNDKIDAQGLAIMGVQQCLEQWKPISLALYSLRSLTRQVESLQNSKTVFKNQLEAASHSAFADKSVIKSLKSIIKKIDKEILACQKKVEKYIVEDQELNSKYKLFANLKGLGLMTFAVIVAETGGFELFKSQSQLVCYTGYDVVQNDSGKRKGRTKISKKGNTHIRRILHMAALNMVRYDIPVFKNLYERIYDRTKVKMKGYAAIQRKLLCLVYSLWKRNEAFELDHQTKNTSLEKEPKHLFSVSSERTENKKAVPV
ncbi:MAG TPA: IS110 family transposase [Cytophagales bacterium]|nr:IS110 family transposase [Cytophagales bacterium]